MKKLRKVFKFSIYVTLVLIMAIVLASPVAAADTSCKTKYPIILAHGMGFTPFPGVPNSFPGIVEALQACGATVYYTTVPAIQSNAVKSAAFKDGFLAIQAADGSAKFNIIGHSQGGLYTRYAITNLSLSPYVASLTTVDSPHRGSFIDSYLLNLVKLFPLLKSFTSSMTLFPGDQTYIDINEQELSVEYMTRTFNPKTPNVNGIYYQSWTGAYRHYNIVKAIYDEMVMILQAMFPRKSAGTMDPLQAAKQLYNMLPDTAAACLYLGAGQGDGLVQVSSAKWGTFLGTQYGPSYSIGLNHLDVVNMQLNGQVWDAVGYWVKTVKDLKAKGY
jgi:triacylglycerol lipase